jgi:hypothetical protein
MGKDVIIRIMRVGTSNLNRLMGRVDMRELFFEGIDRRELDGGEGTIRVLKQPNEWGRESLALMALEQLQQTG